MVHGTTDRPPTTREAFHTADISIRIALVKCSFGGTLVGRPGTVATAAESARVAAAPDPSYGIRCAPRGIGVRETRTHRNEGIWRA
ncbi:hypothetical protein Vqi01_45430 [Micromonospora qiuiae]|uniref:Uncharacterized protein n=1 Tax=Micromonospora qiuiae TaxID=502268 RepID=A0ABQ4JIQ3_9ACTN|nr:hypothetical protein Vqi01_45430 [Micromonospora qiuiae]